MLKTIVVGEYVVSEAGPMEAARAYNFGQQYTALLEQAKDAGDSLDPEFLDMVNSLSLWPQVGACISPRVDQVGWLQIPLATIQELRDAAEKLNPSWFSQLTPKADAQKKRQKPRKSTSG
jgi:hypothetical protein